MQLQPVTQLILYSALLTAPCLSLHSAAHLLCVLPLSACHSVSLISVLNATTLNVSATAAARMCDSQLGRQQLPPPPSAAAQPPAAAPPATNATAPPAANATAPAAPAPAPAQPPPQQTNVNQNAFWSRIPSLIQFFTQPQQQQQTTTTTQQQQQQQQSMQQQTQLQPMPQMPSQQQTPACGPQDQICFIFDQLANTCNAAYSSLGPLWPEIRRLQNSTAGATPATPPPQPAQPQVAFTTRMHSDCRI